MRRLFGVPYSMKARLETRESLLRRACGDFRKALDQHDNFLEKIANRSSALCSSYSVFLALVTLIIPLINNPKIQLIIGLCAAAVLLSVLMLLPCLWIRWQKNSQVYESAEEELFSTSALLYFRSTLFNGSIILCTFALIAATALVLVDKFILRQ